MKSGHAIAVLCAALLLGAGAGGAHAQLALRGGGITLEADDRSGAILRVTDSSSGITLAPPAASAEIFRLTLQKPDKTAATIMGRDQRLSSSRVEGATMTLEWKGPLKDTAGTEHPIAVKMTISAAGRGLIFGLHAENGSTAKVQEALYPFVGGLVGFAPARGKSDTTLWAPTSTPTERPLLPTAGGAAFGYPGHLNMAFTCVQSRALKTTLYVASHDPVARYKVVRFVETGPAGATDLAACVQHTPLLPPGRAFDGSPVMFRFVDGDWTDAARVYREWFQSAFGVVQPADDWIRRQSFFLMTMFMLPEGTISYTFKDIPRWARAAKACGLGAVQISGWQMGGHDNGYPLYRPDPRLGTWKELEDGIRACHRMGLKVYFFVNYQPMMVEMDWYKKELHRYREMTADGGHTWMAGWGMGTLWARAGHPKLMTWADLSFPQFRKIIVDDFAKLARIGADGVHVDKMFPAAIDYNPDIPLSPDTATWEGAIELTREIMRACRKANPDWRMSFECNWDRLLQFGGATWWVGNQLITRKVFPEHVETLGLYQAYDYLGVNNAVREGHAVMVAPMNFSRAPDWPPFQGLARYIRQVKQIRDALQDAVFFGEALGAVPAMVPGGSPDGVAYNVFRSLADHRRVCVLTNSRMQDRTLTLAGFEGMSGGRARVHVPGRRARTVSLPASLVVPAERIIFVEEMAAGGKGEPSASSKGLRPAARPVERRPERSLSPVENGAFESGGFEGWTADPNWVVAGDSRTYYSGWAGRYWAWSGGTGEPATGVLRSKPFVLDRDAVSLLISGWSSIHGTGQPRRWNYVTLNLADGTEIDRVYAPDATVFVPVFLDGSRHRGKTVYLQAVDDADQPTFSMLCIDDVRTADFPRDYAQPVKPLPAFDPGRSLRIEDDRCLVEVSRANGSVTRIRDKQTGMDLLLDPRLAGSYRFALPIPGQEPWQTIEANWIFGRDQKLTSYQVDGHHLTLRWDGPLKNYLGEPFDVSATMTIEMRGGGVLFGLAIDNPTGYPVGETYFPVLGGMQGLGTTYGQLKATEMIRPSGGPARAASAPAGFTSSAIFKVFNNMSWLGDQGPEQFYPYPESQPQPWVGFSAPKAGRSVLIGALDPADRNLYVRLEMVPASAGTPRDDGNWPRPSELRGQPVGVELSFVDVKGGPAGRRYEAAPIFLRFLDGGGAEMAKEYAGWKTAGKP